MACAYEVYDFIRNCKSLHLTLADIRDLEEGDELDVVIWDRNLCDYMWNDIEAGKIVPEKHYDPQEFFEQERCKLTYRGNMEWDIYFTFGESIRHPIHLDVSSLGTGWLWDAIDENDGMIRITSEVIADGEEHLLSKMKAIHKHWTEFPDSTRVGWRGPIMLWDRLAGQPQVYHAKYDFPPRDEHGEEMVELPEGAQLEIIQGTF